MANRKLQVEIERTLKKVTEGLEIFHETLDKLNTAVTPNQKEKVETDLKKEIKKLQRLRDLIKGWQTLSEIKDKQALHDSRRSIEMEMERFKVLEKEMKIKAFSKEGLNQTAKLDPKEKERLELAQWINNNVDRLNTQIDAFEAEIESLQLFERKNKRLDGAKQQRLDALGEFVERHKYHVRKLELILRLLENERLSCEEVTPLKEDVDYYIESNQEHDFMENEQIYDDLNLADTSSFSSSEDEDEDNDIDIDDGQGGGTRSTKSDVSEDDSIHIPQLKVEHHRKKSSDTTISTNSANGIKIATKPATKPVPSVAKKTPIPVSPTSQSYPASASGITIQSINNVSNLSPILSPSVLLSKSIGLHATISTPSIPISPIVGKGGGPSFASAASASITTPVNSPTIGFTGTAAPSAPQTVQQSPGQVSSPTTINNSNSAAVSTSPILATGASTGKEKLCRFGELSDFLANRLSNHERPLSIEEMTVGLEASMLNCPDSFELERCRSFIPKQPFSGPTYYPTSAPLILENPAIFERFDLDTLFFIFYYRQKSYAQYLAARELKRQSWRFHKKYLTWFQRHEEPKTVTEEYEQGTYIYFDYEGSWCQRKKTEFTFEYRYLEDEETV